MSGYESHNDNWFSSDRFLPAINEYYTACIGKWHLGFNWALKENAPQNPEESVFNSWGDTLQNFIDFTKPVKGGPIERGFNYYFRISASNDMQPYVYIENDSILQIPSEDQFPYYHYINAKKSPDWDIKTVNQVLTRKAVQIINNHFTENRELPLFLYFPTGAIHRPCLPTFTKGKSQAGLRGDMVVELDLAFAEIKGKWNFIEAAEPGHWAETFYPEGPSNMEPQLYNLENDLSEQNNLYDQMPEKVSELKDNIEIVKRVNKSEAVKK